MIPEWTKQTIDNYVHKGWEPGDFVRAVMANDLMASYSRADDNNTRHMVDIVRYVYNKTPVNCHGSYKIVEDWLNSFRKKPEE